MDCCSDFDKINKREKAKTLDAVNASIIVNTDFQKDLCPLNACHFFEISK